MSHEFPHLESAHKRTALVIALFALILAFSEALGKSAQTGVLGYNIEAANLWSFYQAKTIRQTVIRTALEAVDLQGLDKADADVKAALDKHMAAWRDTLARYESEPSTREGRKELAARARDAETRRDRSLAAYHHYETASASLQIAVLLASAEIITGAAFLLWIAGGLGGVGLALCLLGYFTPLSLHLF